MEVVENTKDKIRLLKFQ